MQFLRLRISPRHRWESHVSLLQNCILHFQFFYNRSVKVLISSLTVDVFEPAFVQSWHDCDDDLFVFFGVSFILLLIFTSDIEGEYDREGEDADCPSANIEDHDYEKAVESTTEWGGNCNDFPRAIASFAISNASGLRKTFFDFSFCVNHSPVKETEEALRNGRSSLFCTPKTMHRMYIRSKLQKSCNIDKHRAVNLCIMMMIVFLTASFLSNGDRCDRVDKKSEEVDRSECPHKQKSGLSVIRCVDRAHLNSNSKFRLKLNVSTPKKTHPGSK